MSRRRVLVLDGPHAGTWVPDYGNACELLDPWSAISALAAVSRWDVEPRRRLYVKVGWVRRTSDDILYVVLGYASRTPLAGDPVPHFANLAITAEALLSS